MLGIVAIELSRALERNLKLCARNGQLPPERPEASARIS